MADEQIIARLMAQVRDLESRLRVLEDIIPSLKGGGIDSRVLLRGGMIGLVDGVTAPGALAGYAMIYVDTSGGDLKVVFSDGFVRTIGLDS